MFVDKHSGDIACKDCGIVVKERKRKRNKTRLPPIKNDYKLRHKSRTLSLEEMMILDAGKGLEDFNRVYKINVFDEANNVRNYKQLERYIENYIPSMSAADVAWVAAKYAKDNWMVVKIMKDPDNYAAVSQLLNSIAKKNAKKVYNGPELKRFIMLTGYKKPRTDKTFQEHVTLFKDHRGQKRSKKKVAHYLDKEFKI